MSGLDNLRSIFQDELQERVESFKSTQPVDKFDTKLNYNENVFNENAFTFSADLTQRGGRDNPLLDSVLRGRVYEPIRFSQDFVNDNLFVKPEIGELSEAKFKTDLFDPRSTTPKPDTLYFNTNKSFNPATNPTDFSTASGNNNLPFIPITSLGGQFKENLSWKNLYNSNHTPKDNPTYKGKSAVGYGPNVNRDKLNIRDNETNSSIFNLSRRTLAGLGEGEPYVVGDIPINDSSLGGGRLSNQGPLLGVPINRMLTDTLRIGKFLSSAKGLSFIAAQNFLGSNSKSIFISKDGKLQSARQRFKQTYNPLSTLAQTGLRAGFGPVALIDKTEPNLGFGIFEAGEYPNFNEIGGNANHDLNKTFTDGVSNSSDFGFGDLLGGIGDAIRGRTGVPTDVPTTIKGDKMTLAPMIKGTDIFDTGDISNITPIDTRNDETALSFSVDNDKDGIPFYFRDLRDNNYIFFRAYIEGLTENITPTYNQHDYVGRSEPVWTYSSGFREISMTLKLYAQTKNELDRIYEKMDRLTSLCYPQYINEGKTGYGTRMKPPLTKLRYGELYGKTNNELMGYIKSLSYVVEQSSPYETETGKRVPKYVLATIGYQVIHDEAPSLDTKFYGINYE